MIKQITILLLTLTTFCSYGQGYTEQNPVADFKRVQFGINFSTDVAFRTLKTNNDNPSGEVIIEQRNKIETIKLGYTTGLNACYNINNFLGLESGIQYSNKGYQTKKQDLIFENPDPTLPEKSQFIYNLHYIDIPLKVNFTAGKKKVRFFTSAGLTANIFIKKTQTTIFVYSDRTERNANPSNFDFNRINISPTASIGIDYKINERMNLRVEPTFRYGVLKIIDSPVTGYLYSGGLNIGYYFGL